MCFISCLSLGRLVSGIVEMCKKIAKVTKVKTLLNKAGLVGVFHRD